MDSSNGTQPEVNKNNKTQQGTGVPYPVETVDNILEAAKTIVDQYGTGKPITKEEIGKTIGKSTSTLSQYFSTFTQYGIFNLSHGKGYLPTELYKKYVHWVHDGDQEKYKLEMLRRPPLYTKIFENLLGQTLPIDGRRLANLLKEEPYNVSEFGAERAARIFLENARNLHLLDSHNTLRLPSNETKTHKPKEEPKETPPPPKKDPSLFELPIPLSGKRKAILMYPLEDLTKNDIRVILKAVSYIASTVLNEQQATEIEIEIDTEVKDIQG